MTRRAVGGLGPDDDDPAAAAAAAAAEAADPLATLALFREPAEDDTAEDDDDDDAGDGVDELVPLVPAASADPPPEFLELFLSYICGGESMLNLHRPNFKIPSSPLKAQSVHEMYFVWHCNIEGALEEEVKISPFSSKSEVFLCLRFGRWLKAD